MKVRVGRVIPSLLKKFHRLGQNSPSWSVFYTDEGDHGALQTY